MGRKSRLFGWIGLGSLGFLLLLTLSWLKALPFRVAPPVRQTSCETAPPSPVVPDELFPALPASPAAKANNSLNQVSPPATALPDMVASKPRRAGRSESYQRLEGLIKKYAALHGVDEELVWAVMRHESGFDPQAVSPKGAMGLMQLMPGTAALLGVKDPFNVEQNIQGGIKYLEMCLARFDQDVGLALAAYNAGPENVAKYRGCPPFPETRQYVAAVMQDYSGPPQRRGLRLRAPGLISPPEAVEPSQPSGLQWNLPAPVVQVSQPQWRLRPPRWHDFSLPWKLQALAAKSPARAPRLVQPQ